jgi:MoaA/NifB/PqqE/SkfB family radical SAM enzyme
MEKPIFVVFDVTRLCNERCRMCNIWRTKSDDMTLEEIKVAAKRLAQNGVSYVSLQGGDPTMRADILEIVDIFNAVKIKPMIITNGILFKDGLAEGLARRRCNVSVSLDTLDKETFAYIRGVDKLETVMENIKNAPKKRKGNWSIGCTVTGLSTLEEIKRLEEFSARNNFMFVIRPYVHNLGNAGKEDDRLVYNSEKEVVSIFEYMRNNTRKKNYIASLIYDEGLRYVKKVIYGGGGGFRVCDALRRSFVMSPRGLFAPCLEFTNESQPLEDLLKSRKTWLVRTSACNKNTPCFYGCAREIGILWHEKWRILIHFPGIVMQLFKYGNFF